MTRAQANEKEREAVGHLVAAADEAERLTMLLTSMQQIIKVNTGRADLIGGPMADTIESLAETVVTDIRLAVKAHSEAADSGKA